MMARFSISALILVGLAGAAAQAQQRPLSGPQIAPPSAQQAMQPGYPRDPRRPPAPPTTNYPTDVQHASYLAAAKPGEGRGGAPVAVPVAPPALASQRGSDLISAAARSVASRASITAKLRQEIELFDQHLIGAGNYWQISAPVRLWRLELVLKNGERQSVLQQVCNGRQVSIFERIGEQQTLKQLDLAQIHQALVAEQQAHPKRGPALADWGTGGLPQLLDGVTRAWELTAGEQVTWHNKKVWKVTGVWKKEMLAALIPDQKEKIRKGAAPDMTRLPPHLPDTLVVYLGVSDLFPYRIEYLRTPRPSWYARLWTSTEPRPVATFELFDVVFGHTIDPRLFTFSPGNLAANNATEDQIAQIKNLAEALTP